jgi:hypothetical protein
VSSLIFDIWVQPSLKVAKHIAERDEVIAIIGVEFFEYSINDIKPLLGQFASEGIHKL